MKVITLPIKSLVLAIAVFSTTANAAVMADYEFLGSDARSADLERNSVASDLVFGNGDFGLSDSSDNAFICGNLLNTSEGGAFADDDYFSFTVTPETNVELDLTLLGFTSILRQPSQETKVPVWIISCSKALTRIFPNPPHSR